MSCGQNEVGQLGFNDDVIERTRPALVVDTSAKVVDVSAGGMHSKEPMSNKFFRIIFRFDGKVYLI